MKRYTIRRIDGHWTLFDGTGPIARAYILAKLRRLVPEGAQIEVCGKRGKRGR